VILAVKEPDSWYYQEILVRVERRNVDEISKLSPVKKREYYRELTRARRQASGHADAACFVYLFVLKEIAAIKVGISVSPVSRFRSLPQRHMQVEDVFDLERSVAIYAQRRQDARLLERATLQHYAQWQVEAPSGGVVYVDTTRMCSAPIRRTAGGEKEWLDASVYNEVVHFLLFKDRDSPRPSISMGALIKGLQESAL
jgi:hypothetical protein